MLSSLALAVLGGATATHAIPTVEAVGNKLFTGDGNQFFIKGVAYQLTPQDPLADTDQCTRDASLMKTLGANAIRVYHVNPELNHDGCMKAFENAGIYVMVDMDTFSSYILPEAPAWNQTQFEAYSKVMDVFHGYSNLLALFVGNEIIAKNTQSMAAPYIKAAARDLKAYRNKHNYREIPIGYSAADIAELRPMLQDYLTCGGNASENVDFFGLNSYQWCDPTSYETSGYSSLEEQAKNFPVPIFFSETGCNVPGPRLFADQEAIFNMTTMGSDWSGAVVYEWIQEENHYGLVTYGSEAGAAGGFGRQGKPTPVSPDFQNLQSQWAKVSPTGVARHAYDAKQVSTRECPMSTQAGWLVNGNPPLPTVGDEGPIGGGSSPKETGTGTSSKSSPSSPTDTPSGSGSGSGSSSDGSSDSSSKSGTGDNEGDGQSPAEGNSVTMTGSSKMAGMVAGLTGVLVVFTVWL